MPQSLSLVYALLRSLLSRIAIRYRLWKACHIWKANDVDIQLLEEIYPDNGNSCLCVNSIVPQYDLHIIVAVYNMQSYIVPCIQSILAQETFYSYFLTVIDDGSTDNTPQELEAFRSNDHVEVLIQRNQGQAAARNLALKHIRGRYVSFVDADDRMPPGAIQCLMQAAEEQQADIIQGAFLMIDAAGFPMVSKKANVVHNPVDELNGYLCGKLYRASLFHDVCLPQGYWFEDSLLPFILFPKAKKKVVLPTVVYHYRQHESSTTKCSQGSVKSLDSLYVVRRLLADRKALGLPYDMECYNTFLQDMPSNFRRAILLSNPKIAIAVFRETQRLRQFYFPNMYTLDATLQLREKALICNDFRLYAQACL